MADKAEILAKLREYYHLSRNAEFARFFEISEQNAYSWSKRKAFDIETVYAHCPEISPDWLLTGEGEMLRKDRYEAVPEGMTGAGRDSSEHLKVALGALAKEQEITREAQAQLSAIIEIMKSLTSFSR